MTEFTKCLESADVNSCSWYLEQLKAVSIFVPISRLVHRHLTRCLLSLLSFIVPSRCRPVLAAFGGPIFVSRVTRLFTSNVVL